MISAVIITKNEEKMLEACLNSLGDLVSDIVVVDNGSTDRTIEIATRYGAQITVSHDPSFANRRDMGAKLAKGEWLLYIDADERITPELAREIKQAVTDTTYGVYIINRKDYYFGQPRPTFSPMHRLIQKALHKGWKGTLHETPTVDGKEGQLQNYFIHLTHTDINSMLSNTMKWSDYEAQLRFDAHHPPIVGWRLVRIFFTGFWNSFVTQKGYQCGTAGWVEAMYQGCSLFITYAKLWELQNAQQIQQKYKELDRPFIETNAAKKV